MDQWWVGINGIYLASSSDKFIFEPKTAGKYIQISGFMAALLFEFFSYIFTRKY